MPEYQYTYRFNQTDETRKPSHTLVVERDGKKYAQVDYRYRSRIRAWVVFDVYCCTWKIVGSRCERELITTEVFEKAEEFLNKINADTKCQRTIFDNAAYFLKYKLFKRR